MQIPPSSRRLLRPTAIAHILACLFIVAVGCTPTSPPQPTAKYAGMVTIGGEPIAEGDITFMPQSAGQARPESAKIVDGKYEAEHVPQGSVKVMITASKETGKVIEIPNSTETYPEVVSIVPAKYAMGIDIQVTDDDHAKNFDLTN